MLMFYSNANYKDGTNVNYVINELQQKYHFLDKFESYVMSNINRFKFDYSKKFPKSKFNQFMTQLFREYIVYRIHGIHYKNNGMIEFINTGLLVTTTKVRFINN